jgi:hypothetical protein
VRVSSYPNDGYLLDAIGEARGLVFCEAFGSCRHLKRSPGLTVEVEGFFAFTVMAYICPIDGSSASPQRADIAGLKQATTCTSNNKPPSHASQASHVKGRDVIMTLIQPAVELSAQKWSCWCYGGAEIALACRREHEGKRNPATSCRGVTSHYERTDVSQGIKYSTKDNTRHRRKL